jgi:hypothetical protein
MLRPDYNSVLKLAVSCVSAPTSIVRASECQASLETSPVLPRIEVSPFVGSRRRFPRCVAILIASLDTPAAMGDPPAAVWAGDAHARPPPSPPPSPEVARSPRIPAACPDAESRAAHPPIRKPLLCCVPAHTRSPALPGTTGVVAVLRYDNLTSAVKRYCEAAGGKRRRGSPPSDRTGDTGRSSARRARDTRRTGCKARTATTGGITLCRRPK